MTTSEYQIYDIETYPNCFTCIIKDHDSGVAMLWEISERVNQGIQLYEYIRLLNNNGSYMVGYNNINFDYPVIHELMKVQGKVDAGSLYNKAQSIINNFNNFHRIRPNEQYCKQLDLFLIHHFDNRARSTSLKIIEFNNRSENISDLPYEPGTVLTSEQIDVLIRYNLDDVNETHKFFINSKPAVDFRTDLTHKYQIDMMNFNDTKIGKQFFINQLQANNIQCYKDKKPIQTKREKIHLKDALFDYVYFNDPEFNRIVDYFSNAVITETKGVFDDLSCKVKGFQFDFGLGGIHGSINNKIVRSAGDYLILDLDVTSYYPMLGIANRVFPQHLSEYFCDVYAQIMEMRKQTEKGSPDNALLKLALNGVYGDTNNQYSPFYDPLYTMTITINGQLLLCMLAEQLLEIPFLNLIQINTDGLTVRVRKDKLHMVQVLCDWWQTRTGLTLESAHYESMYIRDVNSYIATSWDDHGNVYTVKRKGAYQHMFNPAKGINKGKGDLDWNQNHSKLVVPKVAEYALTKSMFNYMDYLVGHNNPYDFCSRVKIPRNSHLMLGDKKIQNTTRYIVSEQGESMYKLMPPTATQVKAGKKDFRQISIEKGWLVTECNNMEGIKDSNDFNPKIEYEYYRQEIEKLISPLQEF